MSTGPTGRLNWLNYHRPVGGFAVGGTQRAQRGGSLATSKHHHGDRLPTTMGEPQDTSTTGDPSP